MISYYFTNYNLMFLSFLPSRLKDESRSEKVMRNLRTYLNSLPFNFQNASIISGEEEGLYGWITVNYLMDNFLEVSESLNVKISNFFHVPRA